MSQLIKQFQVEQFRPSRWLRAPHVQTLVGNVIRGGKDLVFRRQRLELPDGDFIDLDFADVSDHSWEMLGEKAPIVLAIHGLEGNARRGYMNELYRQVAQRGIRPVGMNMRSCSGEINRLPRFYNAGTTLDIIFVLEWLLENFPDVPVGIVGFSLGGNLTLKFLGERGGSLPDRLQVGAAISPPFQMDIGIKALNQFPGTMYGNHFLRSLNEKVRAKESLLQDKIDLEATYASKTLQDFDEFATAPLGGYQGAIDYYQLCSCAQFLGGIKRPTLILRAQDDPVIDIGDISAAATFADQPCLKLVLTKRGGHVGFIERGGTFWAERQAARFMAQGLFAVRH